MAEIQIWPINKAPKALRLNAAGASEWLVLIPAALVSNAVESLFWRWHDEEHPVIRNVLPDGSILMAGSYPSAATMTPGGILASAQSSSAEPPRSRRR